MTETISTPSNSESSTIDRVDKLVAKLDILRADILKYQGKKMTPERVATEFAVIPILVIVALSVLRSFDPESVRLHQFEVITESLMFLALAYHLLYLGTSHPEEKNELVYRAEPIIRELKPGWQDAIASYWNSYGSVLNGVDIVREDPDKRFYFTSLALMLNHLVSNSTLAKPLSDYQTHEIQKFVREIL